jgi:hypothetical protein
MKTVLLFQVSFINVTLKKMFHCQRHRVVLLWVHKFLGLEQWMPNALQKHRQSKVFLYPKCQDKWPCRNALHWWTAWRVLRIPAAHIVPDLQGMHIWNGFQLLASELDAIIGMHKCMNLYWFGGRDSRNTCVWAEMRKGSPLSVVKEKRIRIDNSQSAEW